MSRAETMHTVAVTYTCDRTGCGKELVVSVPATMQAQYSTAVIHADHTAEAQGWTLDVTAANTRAVDHCPNHTRETTR